jgi:Na+/H+-dicarboxylate symporter
MTMLVSFTQSKKRLAILWFIGAGVVFVIVLLQSVFDRYAEAVEEVWTWLLPTVIPTLSLMIGVFVADMRGGREDKMVDKFMYNVAFALSLFYFLVILLTIFVQPFTGRSPLDLLKISNLWLAPLQGLVAASLGAFFVKGQQ